MEQTGTSGRTCPACGSKDYVFRGRKKVTAEPGQDGPDQIETTYMCKACDHAWREKMAGKAG